jgi:hypothetical protein
MDILVTQGRRARRPYIFDINAMKKTYPIREKSAYIRVLPRPQSAQIRVLNPRPPHHGQMDILVTQGRLASRPYNFGINAVKKTYPIRVLNPRKSAFATTEKNQYYWCINTRIAGFRRVLFMKYRSVSLRTDPSPPAYPASVTAFASPADVGTSLPLVNKRRASRRHANREQTRLTGTLPPRYNSVPAATICTHLLDHGPAGVRSPMDGL